MTEVSLHGGICLGLVKEVPREVFLRELRRDYEDYIKVNIDQSDSPFKMRNNDVLMRLHMVSAVVEGKTSVERYVALQVGLYEAQLNEIDDSVVGKVWNEYIDNWRRLKIT